MKFDELDKKMRVYEAAHDFCVPPGVFIVARLDGRNFTRLTKETHQFEAPFDVKFRDMMADTTRHLMGCGFRIVYAYTESDEISLLFDPQEQSFGRKTRKLNSILAAEASAKFSLALGDLAVFDSRISQLPNMKLVVDYFRWRNEDAFRNALNAHCYWTLRRDGLEANEATKKLRGLSVPAKNELLFQHGVNFNDLPNWQKRGIGFYWETFEKEATNPVTGEPVAAKRRRIASDMDLPMRDEYSSFLLSLFENTDQ